MYTFMRHNPIYLLKSFGFCRVKAMFPPFAYAGIHLGMDILFIVHLLTSRSVRESHNGTKCFHDRFLYFSAQVAPIDVLLRIRAI